MKKNLETEIRKIIYIMLITLTIVSCFRFYSANGIVRGDSMYPTYTDGEKYKLSKAKVKSITYNDVIVFWAASDEDVDCNMLIKRVIAMEGDTIECKNGVLYRNGEAVDEYYLPEEALTDDFEKVTVPENEYFVMGDNREISLDSRYIGCIGKEQVLGVVE